MTECTDKTAKVSEKVLDCKVGHNWIVVEWEYDQDQGSASGYQTIGTISYAVPILKRKRAVKKMCSRCGKIENF